MKNETAVHGKYMKLLPAVFHGEDGAFLESYLKIFEKLLSGADDENMEGKKGIGEVLDIIAGLFYPRLSFMFDPGEDAFIPKRNRSGESFSNYFDADIDEFLEWMAGWVSLALKEDWDADKKREVIAKIIPIYRMRGTRKGLEDFLNIYVNGEVRVYDEPTPLSIGKYSKVGIDTIIDGLPPYFFIVDLRMAAVDPGTMQQNLKTVTELIEREKPAHTKYKINITVPAMSVGENSKVEIDTLIW